jgi:hypothetical protein
MGTHVSQAPDRRVGEEAEMKSIEAERRRDGDEVT